MKRIVAFILFAFMASAQEPELGQGWLPEFNLAARHMLALAEATPAAKFSWRPAPGVRSVSEVYMHLAWGNFWLVKQAGLESGRELKTIPSEKDVATKEETIKWLKESFEAIRKNYPPAHPNQKLRFLNQDSTTEQVMLRILAHNQEHYGQSIAYARMIGVVPPWSK